MLWPSSISDQLKVAFVMEYCNGGSLQQKLSDYTNSSLPEELAKYIIRQLVSAVAHIHSRGWLQRIWL